LQYRVGTNYVDVRASDPDDPSPAKVRAIILSCKKLAEAIRNADQL
jgi:hypothetical protein